MINVVALCLKKLANNVEKLVKLALLFHFIRPSKANGCFTSTFVTDMVIKKKIKKKKHILEKNLSNAEAPK